MPIFDKDILLADNVLLWDITESWEELINLFDNDEELNTIIINTKNDSKKQQFLASRILLKKKLNSWKIKKNKDGKPYPLNSDSEISISHDRKIAGLIKSNKPCGIDIQEITLKVNRIRNKFINEKDVFQNSQKEKDLMVLWCAKEALYKINGKPEIFFKDHMIIQETSDENIIIGKIIHPNYQEDYKMRVHFIKNYCLVYTI